MMGQLSKLPQEIRLKQVSQVRKHPSLFYFALFYFPQCPLPKNTLSVSHLLKNHPCLRLHASGTHPKIAPKEGRGT